MIPGWHFLGEVRYCLYSHSVPFAGVDAMQFDFLLQTASQSVDLSIFKEISHE